MDLLRLILALSLIGSLVRAAERFDVVIYGVTPAGIAAAVNAAGEGCTVALVQEDGHLGGGTAGGLSHTDFRTYESLGGTWREFMRRVESHYLKTYGADSPQARGCRRGGYYEPRVARMVFEQMLAEQAKARVLFHYRLTAAKTEPNGARKRVSAATFRDLKKNADVELTAKVFIDATYEGDLIAAAGAAWRIGCEARSEYGETLAPEQANRFVMATNFRVTLTRDPANRLPLPQPSGYDRTQFAKVLALVRAGMLKPTVVDSARWPLDQIIRARPVPNDKADFNDRHGSPISIKLVEETHGWPEADHAERARLFALAKSRALGMFWFLAHDEELPEWMRTAMSEWGLPRDEYPDTEHWSPFLYVREGRRLIGEATFIEKNARAENPGAARTPLAPEAIAIGDYGTNSHGTHHDPATGELRGHFGGGGTLPWQVPYGCLVPRDIDGLLAPVPVSASHVGYAAIRMEPSWTALGQAAGLAAAQAVLGEKEVRAVDVPTLQRRLHALGAKTIYISDLEKDSPLFAVAQFLGTRAGFLHAIEKPGGDQPAKLITPDAQWSTALPRHALEPDRLLDAVLATAWRARFAAAFPGIVLPPEALVADGQRTRGEALQELWSAPWSEPLRRAAQ